MRWRFPRRRRVNCDIMSPGHLSFYTNLALIFLNRFYRFKNFIAFTIFSTILCSNMVPIPSLAACWRLWLEYRIVQACNPANDKALGCIFIVYVFFFVIYQKWGSVIHLNWCILNLYIDICTGMYSMYCIGIRYSVLN